MKGNCFPFILIILIILGCVFVKKEDQIREAFGGFKEGFREGQARVDCGMRWQQYGTRCTCDNCNVNTIVRNLGAQYRNDPNICRSRANWIQCRQAGGQWRTNAPPPPPSAPAARPPPPRLGGAAPDGWTKCADEGGTCNTEYRGKAMVRYGKGNTWSACRAANGAGRNSGKLGCNNQVFGDPIHGTRKECQFRRDAATNEAGCGGTGAKGAAAGGARPAGPTCVENDVVRVNGAWRNCCVKCGPGYSATSTIGDGGRCLTCGIAPPPPPPRKCTSYSCPCGNLNNGEQLCADNKCTQTQCCSRIPKETIPHCISQLSWGRNCAKCDPEGWELSNAPKRVPDKKVSGGGDRYFRPNGVLDPKTWTKCADRNGRCTVKDSRGKYWFRTSQGGGWSSSREWNAQEKTGGILCNAPSCQKAMEGGAIHDKGKHIGNAKNSGAQPTCGSQTVPSPPPPDCFKLVASDCKKIAQIPIDNCIRQRDWGKSCNACAVGYKMLSDKTRCDLIPIPFCKNQEREICHECQEAYRIGKTGRTCDRIPKEKIPHCTNQRDWGAYCYECGSDQSGWMTSEDKSKCIPRPISNCKDQEGLRCNRCRFGYSKSLDWKSCDIVAIKDCAIQNKSICTECKMGYKMGEDRRKCDLLPISNCQARYEAFRPGQGFGKDRVFSKAS